jgi:hypothetical protein
VGDSLAYVVGWNTVTVSGDTLQFSGLDVTGSIMSDLAGDRAQITSACLTVTLTPQVVSTSGIVSGSISLVSTVGQLADRSRVPIRRNSSSGRDVLKDGPAWRRPRATASPHWWFRGSG